MNQILKKVDERFDEKFVKMQDILNATEENPIVFGTEPPIEDVRQFIHAEIKQAILDVLKSKEKLDHFCKCENKNFISWEADEYFDIINELEE